MKQAVMTEPGKLEFRQVPVPRPGPGEVLLKIMRVGVCGSDVHVWHGRHPFTGYPVVQGHEFSAVVEASGEGAEEISAGTKVTALPQRVCGTCPPCARGDYNICNNLKVEGFQAPGAAQDYFVAPAERIVVLPDNFTFEQGAFIEPAAVAVHATSRPGDLNGKNVVVAGAGPIGNLVGQAARARGANVLITDLSEARLDISKRSGLKQVLKTGEMPLKEAARRFFGDKGFDTAFECSGAETAINSLIVSIEKGGSIVVVAIYSQQPRVELSKAGDRELLLMGSLMYRKPDYEQAAKWIAEGKIIAEPLDSRHFPFNEYAAAYHFIDSEGANCMKVFIDVNDE